MLLGTGARIDQGASINAGLATIDGKVVGPLKVRAQRIVLGPLLAFAITIAGLGACVLEWHRRRQGRSGAPG